MKTLDRKLIRELYGSKALLLAITGIVAVGITVFVSMRSAYHNLDEAKQRYYRQCRMADFSIELTKAPVAELDRIEKIPGIAELRPRIVFEATCVLEDALRPISERVLSLPVERRPVINQDFLGFCHEEACIEAFRAIGWGDRTADEAQILQTRRNIHIVQALPACWCACWHLGIAPNQ